MEINIKELLYICANMLSIQHYPTYKLFQLNIDIKPNTLSSIIQKIKLISNKPINLAVRISPYHSKSI